VVQITAVPSVAEMVGVTRVLQGVAIPSVLGDRNLSKDMEKQLRRKYILRALDLLQTKISTQHVFGLESV